jgi:cytochrome c oxidase subunit IV
VLAWEAIALLYALVVAGPFLLLGLLTWLALRLRRRREEARLLAK